MKNNWTKTTSNHLPVNKLILRLQRPLRWSLSLPKLKKLWSCKMMKKSSFKSQRTAKLDVISTSCFARPSRPYGEMSSLSWNNGTTCSVHLVLLMKLILFSSRKWALHSTFSRTQKRLLPFSRNAAKGQSSNFCLITQRDYSAMSQLVMQKNALLTVKIIILCT